MFFLKFLPALEPKWLPNISGSLEAVFEPQIKMSDSPSLGPLTRLPPEVHLLILDRFPDLASMHGVITALNSVGEAFVSRAYSIVRTKVRLLP